MVRKLKTLTILGLAAAWGALLFFGPIEGLPPTPKMALALLVPFVVWLVFDDLVVGTVFAVGLGPFAVLGVLLFLVGFGYWLFRWLDHHGDAPPAREYQREHLRSLAKRTGADVDPDDPGLSVMAASALMVVFEAAVTAAEKAGLSVVAASALIVLAIVGLILGLVP